MRTMLIHVYHLHGILYKLKRLIIDIHNLLQSLESIHQSGTCIAHSWEVILWLALYVDNSKRPLRPFRMQCILISHSEYHAAQCKFFISCRNAWAKQHVYAGKMLTLAPLALACLLVNCLAGNGNATKGKEIQQNNHSIGQLQQRHDCMKGF